MAQQLHDYVGVVRYEPPELAVRLTKPFAGDFARDLTTALKSLTGMAWTVSILEEGAAEPTLLEQEKAEGDRVRQSVLDSPMVKAAFDAFPDAELIGYTLDQQGHG
jgi:DNA polymerase-3 subunit gamma/tau